MNDVRKLVDRLLVVAGEEAAEIQNYHNEKVGVKEMICFRLAEFVVLNTKGTGYLIKLFSCFLQNSGKANERGGER